jgi:hypothetical protein
MPPLSWWLVGGVIVIVAFLLRVGVHVGRTPGGVDTWYYLAYADALRRKPALDVELPQYLLQDVKQSYPPLFPTLLALLRHRTLRRFFWAVSPAVDCLHLFLLYFVTFRLTASLAVAALAAAAYACTPHLVSETRSLSARPFGALLHSIAMICLLKYTLTGGARYWLVAAVLSGAALFLSSAAMAAAYGVVCSTLSVVFVDPRYIAVGGGALAFAFVLSGGRYLQVIRNYLHAVSYWRRNRQFYGAHPVRHSPVYGDGSVRQAAQRAGFLGGTTFQQLFRLVGENPFLLALPLAPRGFIPWGPRLWTWAVTLAVLSIVATLLPPLRALGPGRSYMKAGIFPTAYTLAFGIGSLKGLTNPVGIVTLVCLSFSLGAIWFFYAYVRGRETEQTATTPRELAEATGALAALAPGGVFVLPYMYADYVCYNSGKPTLWGGHCGDLARFEAIAPVIRRPLPELFREHGVRFVVLDTLYARPEDLRLDGYCSLRGRYASFELYEASVPPAQA